MTMRQLFFNCALRETLANSELSQGKLAKRVGVSQTHIYRILHNPNHWGTEQVRTKIVQVLVPGMSLDEFIDMGKKVLFTITDFSNVPEKIAENIKTLQESMQTSASAVSPITESLKELARRAENVEQAVKEMIEQFSYITTHEKVSLKKLAILKHEIAEIYHGLKKQEAADAKEALMEKKEPKRKKAS